MTTEGVLYRHLHFVRLEFSLLNSLDIDYLAVYFAQWLTLFEGSVLTWHLAEDVHAMCMLDGPIP